ncbi:unnamed protein product [Dicrocoelium dendriticum]|nr:unnamed protein product [Dicrocoelium dendriticum]
MSDSPQATVDFSKAVELALRNQLQPNLVPQMRSTFDDESAHICSSIASPLQFLNQMNDGVSLSGKPLRPAALPNQPTNLSRPANSELSPLLNPNPSSLVSSSRLVKHPLAMGTSTALPFTSVGLSCRVASLDYPFLTIKWRHVQVVPPRSHPTTDPLVSSQGQLAVNSVAAISTPSSHTTCCLPATSLTDSSHVTHQLSPPSQPPVVSGTRVLQNIGAHSVSFSNGSCIPACDSLQQPISNPVHTRPSLGIITISRFSAQPPETSAHQPITVSASSRNLTQVTSSSHGCRAMSSVIHYRPQHPVSSSHMSSVVVTSSASLNNNNFRCAHCLFTASKVARVYRHMEQRHRYAIANGAPASVSTSLSFGVLLRRVHFPTPTSTVLSAPALSANHTIISSSVSFMPPTNGTPCQMPTSLLPSSSIRCDPCAFLSKPHDSFVSPSNCVTPTSFISDPIQAHGRNCLPVISMVHSLSSMSTSPMHRSCSRELSYNENATSLPSGIWFREQPTYRGLEEDILDATSVEMSHQDGSTVPPFAAPTLSTYLDKSNLTCSAASERSMRSAPIPNVLPLPSDVIHLPTAATTSDYRTATIHAPRFNRSVQLSPQHSYRNASEAKAVSVSETLIILDSSSEDDSLEDVHQQEQIASSLGPVVAHSAARLPRAQPNTPTFAVSHPSARKSHSPVTQLLDTTLAVDTSFRASPTFQHHLTNAEQSSLELTEPALSLPCSSSSSPLILSSLSDGEQHETYTLPLPDTNSRYVAATHELCTDDANGDKRPATSQIAAHSSPSPVESASHDHQVPSHTDKTRDSLITLSPHASCKSPGPSCSSLPVSVVASPSVDEVSPIVESSRQLISRNAKPTTFPVTFAQLNSSYPPDGGDEMANHLVSVDTNNLDDESARQHSCVSPQPSCSSLSSPLTISSLSEEEESTVDAMIIGFNHARQSAKKRLPFLDSCSGEFTSPARIHLLEHNYSCPAQYTPKTIIPRLRTNSLFNRRASDYRDSNVNDLSDPVLQPKHLGVDDVSLESNSPLGCFQDDRLPLLTARKRSVFRPPLPIRDSSRTLCIDHLAFDSTSSPIVSMAAPNVPVVPRKQKRTRRKSPLRPLPTGAADRIYEPRSPPVVSEATTLSCGPESRIVDLTHDSEEECEKTVFASPPVVPHGLTRIPSRRAALRSKSTMSSSKDAQSTAALDCSLIGPANESTNSSLQMETNSSHGPLRASPEESDPSTRIMVDVFTGEVFVDNRPLRQLVPGIKMSKGSRANSILCVTKRHQKSTAPSKRKRRRPSRPSQSAGSTFKSAKHKQPSLSRPPNTLRQTRSHHVTDRNPSMSSSGTLDLTDAINLSHPTVAAVSPVSCAPVMLSG